MTFSPTDLGKGKKGHQPLITGHTLGGGERSANRKYLAKAFGNMYNSGLGYSPVLYNKNILGPFRSAYNAGDVITNSIVATDIRYGRESSQVNGNNLSRVQVHGDGLNRNGSAMFSGNPRFVYDGSDYTRFKKLNAINKNYNDKSFGGAALQAINIVQDINIVGNNPPTFTSTPVTSVAAGNFYTYTVTTSDPDNDSITLSGPVLPSWSLFNPATGVLSGFADFINTGDFNVTLRANDGTVDVDQTFVITVS